jgi:cellulose synthase/poly-beta-1,6-N-acetylglucosamine synthase-like glycosyltransferase
VDTWGAVVVFWGCAFALVYAYLGYPVLLASLTRRLAATAPEDGTAPKVSVIIAAYNEEECIAEKIRNTFAQEYPAHLLECIVVSDGSTDRTAEIARTIADQRLRVIEQSPNQGKCLCLNRAVREATGDVLVFTDANSMLAPSALARLTRHFADPRIGLVSGKGQFVERVHGTVLVVTNTYLRYEEFIREREKRLGYIVWADGALYALRRPLFRDLEPMHSNDFLHPIQAVLAGYRVTFEPTAIFREATSGSARGEFKRQARMIAQGMYVLATEGPKLLARKRWTVAWQLLSHRVLRWMGPLFLLGALGASAYLAPGSPLYLALFVAQVAFYTVALGGALAEGLGVKARSLAVPYYFCLVNLAGVVGFCRVVAGNVQGTWTPVRSA